MAEGGLLARPDDRYANIAAFQVTESAPNTLTFTEVDFGIGLGAGVGLLIDQIDYYLSTSLTFADGDGVVMALSTRNDLTSLSDEFNNRSVIHLMRRTADFTTSGMAWTDYPKVNKFTPPLIVGTNRGKLYAGVEGVSQMAAQTLQMRLYFRYIPLQPAEYLELAEAFNLMG